jgi:hypothetical protein
MTKTLIKKIPLFLLITNSFRGPFKTKTKENLLPSDIFPSPGTVAVATTKAIKLVYFILIRILIFLQLFFYIYNDIHP